MNFSLVKCREDWKDVNPVGRTVSEDQKQVLKG